MALGRLFLAHQDARSAAKEFDRATQIFANSATARNEALARTYRGLAAMQLGDLPFARQCFEAVLQAARARPEVTFLESAALLHLGKIEGLKGRSKQARSLLLDVLKTKIGRETFESAVMRDLANLASTDGRLLAATRLATLAETLDPKNHAGRAWALAKKAGLSRSDHNALREEMRAIYAKDRGWSVIREAFPDLPEKDPAASD